MSYLVEQLPHCDLLRLSLSTGWFVLSAWQVVQTLGFERQSSLSLLRVGCFAFFIWFCWEWSPSLSMGRPDLSLMFAFGCRKTYHSQAKFALSSKLCLFLFGPVFQLMYVPNGKVWCSLQHQTLPFFLDSSVFNILLYIDSSSSSTNTLLLLLLCRSTNIRRYSILLKIAQYYGQFISENVLGLLNDAYIYQFGQVLSM